MLSSTNLQGLRVGGYQFDTDQYWDFIRSGREDFLKPDPEVQMTESSLSKHLPC